MHAWVAVVNAEGREKGLTGPSRSALIAPRAYTTAFFFEKDQRATRSSSPFSRMQEHQSQKRLGDRPEIWSKMSKAAQREEKQEWAIQQPKLDNARRLTGIYFIDREDSEFKDTITNARTKFEVPMEAALPCKVRRGRCKETCGKRDARRSKYPRIVDANEYAGKFLEATQHKDHEDHIAGKGLNSLSHHNLVHKVHPCA